MEAKYQRGKIYIIKNKVNDKVYIGSTIETLSQRFTKHKYKSKKETYKLYNAFQEIGIDNFYMELIKLYPCKSKEELDIEEDKYMDVYDSINNGYNTFRPVKNREIVKEKAKQYRNNNPEIVKQRWKNYYENNKEKLKEKRKKYEEANKDKIRQTWKQYYEKHKEKINERRKENNKLYYENNKDNMKAKRKEYREEHKEEIKLKKKLYYEQNKDKIIAKQKQRQLLKKQTENI